MKHFAKEPETMDYGTIARNHTVEMEKLYHDQIQYSSDNTIQYNDHVMISNERNNSISTGTDIVVDYKDSVSAIFSEVSRRSNHKIAVMNFASFKYPGGAFLSGSMAQEEALCHKSFLYNVLERQTSFYEENQFHLNRGLYENAALYSPSVFFINNEQQVAICNVITCAAPNRSAAMRYQKVSEEENFNVLYSRIKFVLDIAEINNVDILIAGAFGCGVFGQDPRDVSGIFKTLLAPGNYNFKKVIFAIPGGINYNTFAQTFSV